MIPQKGDKIEIGGERFDVLEKLGEEFDWFDSKTEEFIGLHTRIDLHKFGEKKLFATHVLKIYKENPSKGTIWKVNYENPPKDFPNRKLGAWGINFKKEKDVDVESIERI